MRPLFSTLRAVPSERRVIASPIHDLLSVRSTGAARCTFSSFIPAILAPLIALQKKLDGRTQEERARAPVPVASSARHHGENGRDKGETRFSSENQEVSRELSPPLLAKHPFFVVMESSLKVFRGLLAWHAPLRLTFNDDTNI